MHADRRGAARRADRRHRGLEGRHAGSTAWSWLFAVLGFSMPVFVLAYLLIYVFSIELRLAAGAGLRAAPRRLLAVAEPPDPAVRSRSALIYMALIARITRATMLDVLSAGLRPHRACQGPRAQRRADRHALKNAAVPDRHHHRHRHRAADRRRRRHRERVRHSRHRPPDRRCDPAARLSDHPGRDPDVLGVYVLVNLLVDLSLPAASIRASDTDGRDCRRLDDRRQPSRSPTWLRIKRCAAPASDRDARRRRAARC